MSMLLVMASVLSLEVMSRSVPGGLVGAEVALVDQEDALKAAHQASILAIGCRIGVQNSLGRTMRGLSLRTDRGDSPDALARSHRARQLDFGPAEIGHDASERARGQRRGDANHERLKNICRAPHRRFGLRRVPLPRLVPTPAHPS